jgi:hypothetical protein
VNAKYFFPALILITLARALPAQSLTLTRPNGGEKLILGQNSDIRWTAANVAQKVKLQLLRADGALVGLVASDRDAASGYCSWKIGQFAGGAVPPGQYKIRISTLDNTLQDESNSPFTVEPAPPAPPGGLNTGGETLPPPPPVGVQLISPSDGKHLQIGQSVRIRWISSGLSGSNQVELWQGANRIGVIARNQPAFQGDIAWKAGAHEGGTAPAGPKYRVRIVNSGGPEDSSDKFFTLLDADLTASNVSQPVQPKKVEPQKQQPQFNPQYAPYAVIASFKVDGQDDMGGAKVTCRRDLGVVCTASAFSQSQPVYYRYSLFLEDPRDGYRYLVKETDWIAQSSYTFNVSLNAVLTAVFGDDPPSSVPLSMFGGITLNAKNMTQTEPPRHKSIQIKMLL